MDLRSRSCQPGVAPVEGMNNCAKGNDPYGYYAEAAQMHGDLNTTVEDCDEDSCCPDSPNTTQAETNNTATTEQASGTAEPCIMQSIENSNVQNNGQGNGQNQWGPPPPHFGPVVGPSVGIYAPGTGIAPFASDEQNLGQMANPLPSHGRNLGSLNSINPIPVQDFEFIEIPPPMSSNDPAIGPHAPPSGSNVVSLKEHPAGKLDLDVQVRSKQVVKAGHSQYYGPGDHLIPGRYSGGTERWGVNSVPERVPKNSMSEAARKKRGLFSNKDGNIPKRATGVTDPENITIIHMYDNGHSTWQDCANHCNQHRILAGKDPTLTANSCTNRYNRTAPILYAIEGREFIPLSKRRKGFIPSGIPPDRRLAFSAEMEAVLVDCVQEVDRSKWFRVADMFNTKTGLDIDATIAAHRYKII